MVDSDVLRKSLYAILGTSAALYLALLVIFAMDGAYAAIAVSSVGIITVIVGLFGLWKQSFPGLMAYSAMSFAWILLGVIHLAIIGNLININENVDKLFIGNTIASKQGNVQVYQILYPTLYAIAITLTAVGMVLACLVPTPDGNGWNYPWMRSKASLDPYFDEWADDFNPPFPYPFMGPPMLLGIPTFPMAAPKGMMQGMMSRSMPSVYDGAQQGGGSGGNDNGQERVPYRTPRRRSSSNLSFQENTRDSSASSGRRSSSMERRGSESGNRRRSSAADNYGFL